MFAAFNSDDVAGTAVDPTSIMMYPIPGYVDAERRDGGIEFGLVRVGQGLHPAGLSAVRPARRAMNADDRAILIGIDHYPQLGEPGADANLQGPANDVDAVKAWLMDPNGGAFASEDQIQVIKSRLTEAGDTALPDHRRDRDRLWPAQRHRPAEPGPAARAAGGPPAVYLRLRPRLLAGARTRLPVRGQCQRHARHLQRARHGLAELAAGRRLLPASSCCGWTAATNRVSFLQPRDPQLLPGAGHGPRRRPASSPSRRSARSRPSRSASRRWRQDPRRLPWALLQGLRGAASDANGRVTGRSLADWLRNASAPA